MARADRLNSSRATFRSRPVKSRATHCQQLNRITALYSSDHITRINWALKGIGTDNRTDLRDRLNIH